MAFFSFLIRRMARRWQMFLTLGLGVILATALLASGPVLADAVIQLALRRTLLAAEPVEANLRLKVHSQADQAAYEALDDQLQALLKERLGPHLDQIIPAAGSKWVHPWIEGQLLVHERVNLCFYDGIVDRTILMAGEWPSGSTGEPDVVQAVIGEEMAQVYDLAVGDRLPLSFTREADEPVAWIEISGIIRPREPRARYWFGQLSPLRSQGTKLWVAQYSVIVSEGSFFSTTAAWFPGVSSEMSWQTLLAPETITLDDLPHLRERFGTLASDLEAVDARTVIQTDLPDLLAKLLARSEAIRAPLYLLTAEIVLLALYYVTMMAALSVRQVEREFAMLRSRGASGWQILGIQAAEAGLISAVALLSGPVLATLLVKGLTVAGPLAGLDWAERAMKLPSAAWLAAGVGALACVCGLLLPLGPTLRRSIVTHQQVSARETQPPWWQRFYLDVLVLVVGLILLWRVFIYGGILAGDTSNPRLDWLLLVAPLALLLGSAAVLLRLFPLLLNVIAHLTARSRGLTSPLAMWQASRSPAHVARLVLLLTLAMALGILSTGLNATLNMNEFERSIYSAGSDLRLISHSVLTADLESAPGVLAAAGVWRGTGSVDKLLEHQFPRFDVLAVEPSSFASVTNYRHDFAERPMQELLNHLVAEEIQPPPTILLPGRPARLGVWFSIPSDMRADRLGLSAKIQSAAGESFVVRLRPSSGAVSTDGWYYFDTALPELSAADYPLQLRSFWLRERFAPGRVMLLGMDDLTVVDADRGVPQVVHSFEDALTIWMLGDPLSTTSFGTSGAHTGEGHVRLSLVFYQARQGMVLRMIKDFNFQQPLPALVSPAFLRATDLEIGDVVETWVNSAAVSFSIEGVVRYFPTMYENQEGGFLIAPRDLLQAHLDTLTEKAVNTNEAWLALDESASIDELITRVPGVSQIWEAEEVRQTIRADPMGLGLRSVTLFGYTVAALLSLVGFASHFIMSARQRGTSYGILRSVGLSPGQLYRSLLLEQVVLILLGLAMGTALGAALNEVTLPGLPLILSDHLPIPPFLTYDDWLAVGRIYLILAIAFLASLGVATVFLWRARIHRVLRIGEE